MMCKISKNSCPICCSMNYTCLNAKLSKTLGNRQVLVCDHCGHGWDFTDYVNLSVHYQSLYGSMHAPKFHPEFWKITQYLKKKFNSERIRILDIGANNGRFLWHLPKNWDLYGVEPIHGAAETARKHTNAMILSGTIEEIPIEQYGPFDVITCWAVIEHIADPVALLRRMSDCLKKGGQIGLMTGDRSSRVARKLNSSWYMYGPVEHLHFFSETSLDYLLNKTHLKQCKKYWTTGNLVYSKGIVGKKMQKIKNVIYDLTPFTRKNIYDHMYVFADRS